MKLLAKKHEEYYYNLSANMVGKTENFFAYLSLW